MTWFRIPAILALSALLCLPGCGGGSSSSNNAPTVTSTNPAPGDTSVHAPVIISLGPGQSAMGVNINVPAPAASPAPNAEVLGVAPASGMASAFNTGATIHVGSTQRVIVFGPGIDGSMQVIVGGANDVAVANVQSIRATDGTPGISFDATVSGNAALGGRTVYLRNPQNDITAFTSGLEVVP